MTDGNGIKLNYGSDGSAGFDSFGRVIDQNWQSSSGTSVDDFQYGYDADSNVLYKKNTVHTKQSELYTYDNLNRLTNYSSGTLNTSNTSISGTPSVSLTYRLNANGNQNGSSGSLTGVATNAQNEITTANGNTLQYDPNGNLATDQNGDTYVYDDWNRLVSVTTSTDTISFTFDALGRRITETDSSTGITTDNYYSTQGLIEQDQSGSITCQFVFGPFYQNQIIQETNSSGTFYVHQNANWDVTSISNTSGGVVERYKYDPNGNATVMNASGGVLGAGLISSAVGQVIGDQGGYVVVQANIEAFGVRWLVLSLDIWNQPDPIGADGSGNNLYQLEGGNAVNDLDPSGEQSWYQGWGNTVYAAFGGYGGSNAGKVWNSAGEGLEGGAEIVDNTLSFGLTDRIGYTDTSRLQGGDYDASRFLATFGREALITAGTLNLGALVRAGWITPRLARVIALANAGRGAYYGSTMSFQGAKQILGCPKDWHGYVGLGLGLFTLFGAYKGARAVFPAEPGPAPTAPNSVPPSPVRPAVPPGTMNPAVPPNTPAPAPPKWQPYEGYGVEPPDDGTDPLGLYDDSPDLPGLPGGHGADGIGSGLQHLVDGVPSGPGGAGNLGGGSRLGGGGDIGGGGRLGGGGSGGSGGDTGSGPWHPDGPFGSSGGWLPFHPEDN